MARETLYEAASRIVFEFDSWGEVLQMGEDDDEGVYGPSSAIEKLRTAVKAARVRSQTSRPCVVVEVSGGVAEETVALPGVGRPQVYIVDWDNLKTEDESDYGPELPRRVRTALKRIGWDAGMLTRVVFV